MATDPHFPPGHFDEAYRSIPGWEIGTPQPDLLQLLDEFPPADPVLEVGCGTGELSIAIAQRGHDVLGVDIAAAAIDKARRHLTAVPTLRRGSISFRTGDALRPSSLGGPFGAIVDSGFSHLFSAAEWDTFVTDMTRAVRSGGRYYILAFAVQGEYQHAPRQITIADLEARFTAESGWHALALRSAGFVSNVLPEPIPATLGCLERT